VKDASKESIPLLITLICVIMPMKKRIPQHLERYRVTIPGFANGPNEPIETNGAFLIPYRGRKFKVIVSTDGGWDHVSISLPFRCPTWDEMAHFKALFFEPHETVVQFHPDKKAYVNFHPNCLHLWRNQAEGHTLPPAWMVGPLKTNKH
jgi:hypothetical protein